jgi:protein translocase SecG subunit
VLPALLAAATTVPTAVKASAAPAAKATTLPLTLPPNFSFDTTPHSPLATHAPWLTHFFAGLFILAGVLLIVMLALQTTKQEGLSGTLGGRVESSTRRLGLDAQIARVTGTIAVAFVVIATIVSLSGI